MSSEPDMDNISQESAGSIAEPMLVQVVGAVNIVMYRRMYYAIPKNLGPIDLHKESVIGRPGVRVAGSLTGVLQALGAS